jgi:seryl-tRNA synthetase
MLDVSDFIVEKGGNPQKIKDSQKRRYAPEEAVDEVIALYEDHRKSELQDSNALQKRVY